MKQWLFVDDSVDEREAFAAGLSSGTEIEVVAISVAEARGRLANGSLVASGILMDIDLSNESTTKESGLGFTADIRAAQHRDQIPSYPIVRFSYRDRVAASIGRDSSSDDYFDFMIDKDNLDVVRVQRWLDGIGTVYEVVLSGLDLLEVLNINDEEWPLLGSAALDEDFKVADFSYGKAGVVVQVLVQPGVLIVEDLLAVRLGIDLRVSSGWGRLREALSDFKYSGAAAANFARWWARGLEQWWEAGLGEVPLAATTITDRCSVLSDNGFSDLVPLVMPDGSLGERPWRYCELSLSERGDMVPLDPSRGVRFALHKHARDWMDPSYAALGPAMRHVEDPRLNSEDLERLSALVQEPRQ